VPQAVSIDTITGGETPIKPMPMSDRVKEWRARQLGEISG
jgi:hypothetical protein